MGERAMRKTALEKKEERIGYLFLLPNLVGFLVFTLFPVGFSLVLSLCQWNLSGTIKFVGLSNFIEILTTDEMFWKVLSNTFYYILLVIPAGFVLAMALALALNKGLKGTIAFRSIFFLPIVISFIAAAMIWVWLFDKDFGVVNYFLWLLGIRGVGWLSDPKMAMISMAVIALWHDTGYNMTIMLAGLQTVPKQLYEAAEIDGANAWQKLWNVTLPMLSPTLFFMLVMAIIGSFQVFDLIFVLTGGGPLNSTRTIVAYIYSNGFSYFKMGYASALAWIMFLILFVCTWIQFKLQKDTVFYN